MAMLILAAPVMGGEAYTTTVDDQKDQKLRLDNNALIDVQERLPRLGAGRRTCVLFRDGLSWRIWIEREGTFRCDVEEDPSGLGDRAEVETLEEARYNGEILLMEDGSIYEADGYDVSLVRHWRSRAKILVIRERDAINLDEGDRMISVRKLR
jgi:hypothetical protein